MNNCKFYYLEHEHKPEIIFIDENKKEVFSINGLDSKYIKSMEYPTKKVLNNIIKTSTKDGYDGTWESINFILDEPEILLGLILSDDRENYISSLKYNHTEEYTTIDILIERFWERFENQPMNIAKKYITLYNRGISYFKSLSNEELENILNNTDNISNEEYFYLILEKAKIVDCKINNQHFSF